MINEPWDISIDDIIKYHKCTKRIQMGDYTNYRTCVGCKFNLPIEKFRYINLRRVM